MSHAWEFTLEAPDLAKLVYDLSEAVGKMIPELAAAYRRLHELAVAAGRLPATEIEDWATAIYHAHYVRRHPVLRLHGEKYLCLHKQMLIERFFAGTVHVLADLVATYQPPGWPSDPGRRTLQVRTEFGVIFEDYVQRLVRVLFQRADAVFRFNVRRDDGGECDALVVINRTVLVFEVVHHPWSVAERSRALPTDFIRHLSDNIAKSVKLCAEIIARGSLSDDLGVKVARAIPIVVMSEAVPINEMTALSLQAALAAMIGTEPLEATDLVLPAQSLSVAQLENLDRLWVRNAAEVIPLLQRRSLNILDRFNADPQMGLKLGRPQELSQIDEEAKRDLEKNGPAVFL